jgi:hypothetical protein
MADWPLYALIILGTRSRPTGHFEVVLSLQVVEDAGIRLCTLFIESLPSVSFERSTAREALLHISETVKLWESPRQSRGLTTV